MTRGGIYRRGKTYWIRYYFKGKDRCESSRSTRKDDAEVLLARRLGEIGADEAGLKRWLGPEAERVQVTDLLDSLLLDYEVRHARSIRVATTRVRALTREFYRERVRDVDTNRLRLYIKTRERSGMKPATVRAELATLHRAFVVAQQEGRIAQVPHFPSIEVDNVRQGFFEQGDFNAVVSQLPEYLKDLARFAYLSGWRKQEVMDLTWAEVDLAGRVIKLPGTRDKGKRGRTLALVGDLWEIIQRRALVRHTTDITEGSLTVHTHVFHHDGCPIRQFRRAWKSACERAGVKGMLFHDLRRTTVRNLTRAGVPQRVAMEVTGHRTASVFQRYDIVVEEDIRVAQEKMQSYLKAEGQEWNIRRIGGGET